MLSVLVLTVFLSIINRSICDASLEYIIVKESLDIFENPLIALAVPSSPYDILLDYKYWNLRVLREITENDRLYVNITMKRSDGVQFWTSDNLLLCKLLEKEATNGTLSELKFSPLSVLNLNGQLCPIPAGDLRIKPYSPPQSFINDIGPGTFISKMTIGKYEKYNSTEKPTNYKTILCASINLTVYNGTLFQ